MPFIPINPAAVKRYIDRMINGVSGIGRPVAKSVSISRIIANRMSPHELQEADINFWRIVKAGIEYVIDYATVDAEKIDVNETELSRAYTDLLRLIDWVSVVYGEEWEPELAIGD